MIDGKFGAGFNLIPGLSIDGSQGIHIEASAKSGNSYWMAVGYTNSSIAGIFDAGTSVAGGWNVAKSSNSLLAGIPDYVLTNGRLYGGYVSVWSSIGGNSPVIGYSDFASIEAWYYNNAYAEVYANFKQNAFGFKIGQNWDCGANVNFFGLGIAGADVKANGELAGNYGNGNWAIGGNLAASINAHVGCDGGCNGITWGCCFNPCWPWSHCRICPCPCGGKICVGGSVSVSYSSGGGFGFSLSL